MGLLRPTGLSPNSSAWHSSGVLWAEPGAELGRVSPHSVSQQTLKEHFLCAWPWWSCPPGTNTIPALSLSKAVHQLHLSCVGVCPKRQGPPHSAGMVSLLRDNWGPSTAWYLAGHRRGGRGWRQEAAWTHRRTGGYKDSQLTRSRSCATGYWQEH